MRIEKTLRHRFEGEIEGFLEIANGEAEKERLAVILRVARLRRRKAKRPTRNRCLRVLREQTDEAQTLLGSWMKSARDYGNWSVEHQDLFWRVGKTIGETHYALDSNEQGDEPITSRFYILGKDPLRSFCLQELHWLFVNLLKNPLRYDLVKCDRCGRWFLNRSGHRNKRFCKRRCAVLDSVTRSVKQRRERERAEKLNRAKAAIRDWTHGKDDDWKAWVSTRTSLSVKFLTRALNRRELKAPAGI